MLSSQHKIQQSFFVILFQRVKHPTHFAVSRVAHAPTLFKHPTHQSETHPNTCHPELVEGHPTQQLVPHPNTCHPEPSFPERSRRVEGHPTHQVGARVAQF